MRLARIKSKIMPYFRFLPFLNRSACYARYVFIALIFFLLPSLYVNQNPLTWSVLLSAAAERPTAQDATVLVTGMSISELPSASRVALCIVGHPRSFRQPSVHRSIRERVIRVLRDAGYVVDIFFHMGRGDVPRKGTSAAGRDGLSAAIQVMNPVSVSRYSNTDVCKLPHCAPSSVQCPHALYRISQCLEKIQEYETRTGTVYDWIYKTRPDIAFGTNITTPSSLRSDTLYMNRHLPGTSMHAHKWLREKFPNNSQILGGPVADHIFVASRDVAKVAFRASQAFQDCDLYKLPKGTLNSEVGLTYWLFFNQIRYKAMPWFWMLVRDVEGPECSRVQWIERGVNVRYHNFTAICIHYLRTGNLLDPSPYP